MRRRRETHAALACVPNPRMFRPWPCLLPTHAHPTAGIHTHTQDVGKRAGASLRSLPALWLHCGFRHFTVILPESLGLMCARYRHPAPSSAASTPYRAHTRARAALPTRLPVPARVPACLMPTDTPLGRRPSSQPARWMWAWPSLAFFTSIHAVILTFPPSLPPLF